MRRQYSLEINDSLLPIEKHLEKYYVDTTHLYFTRGERNPLIDRTKLDVYIKNNLVTTYPQMPWLSPYILKDVLELLLMSNSDHYVHFHTDVSINKPDSVYGINHNDSVFDIILNRIPNITDVDIKAVEIGLTNLANHILTTTPFNYSYIHDINVDYEYMSISEIKHIMEHRYEKLLFKDKMC